MAKPKSRSIWMVLVSNTQYAALGKMGVKAIQSQGIPLALPPKPQLTSGGKTRALSAVQVDITPAAGAVLSTALDMRLLMIVPAKGNVLPADIKKNCLLAKEYTIDVAL